MASTMMLHVPATRENARGLGTRVPISFPIDLYEWLREAAFKERISMAEIVRIAVSEYRDRRHQQLDLPINGKRP